MPGRWAAGAGPPGPDGQHLCPGGRRVHPVLLAFELRRQGVGTAGLGLLLAAVGLGGVIGAFLLPRAARLVREDGLPPGGLLLCGTTAWLLAGRVGVASAAAGSLAMGAGIAAARLGNDLKVLGGVTAGELGEELDGAAQRQIGKSWQHRGASAVGAAEAPR